MASGTLKTPHDYACYANLKGGDGRTWEQVLTDSGHVAYNLPVSCVEGCPTPVGLTSSLTAAGKRVAYASTRNSFYIGACHISRALTIVDLVYVMCFVLCDAHNTRNSAESEAIVNIVYKPPALG